MAWSWKKLNGAKKGLIRRGAMAVAKLTYKVQNRVPEDADAPAEREGAR